MRKSFPKDYSGFVFLYETSPISGITGGFFTVGGELSEIKEIAKKSKEVGIEKPRIEAYFAGKSKGWSIPVLFPVKFKKNISLLELQNINHSFAPPQAFIYLNYGDPVFEYLKEVLNNLFENTFNSKIVLEKDVLSYSKVIIDEVSNSYEDINQDFLNQQLGNDESLENAFTTVGKKILQSYYGSHPIGFTILTEKVNRTIKTGPTILYKHFRGIGFSNFLRSEILEFCKKKGFRAIFCTCPDNNIPLINSLIRNGYGIRAILRGHLKNDRNELVFAKELKVRKPQTIEKEVKTVNERFKFTKIKKGNKQIDSALNLVGEKIEEWYFPASPNLSKSLLNSLVNDVDSDSLYSSKPRMLFYVYDIRKLDKAVLICTSKRSKMLKINLISNSSSAPFLDFSIKSLLKEIEYRRYYCTLPTTKESAIKVLLLNGFEIEGVLPDPFGQGVDHFCFGLNQDVNGSN
ncbi:hypothetical protein LEP1GSC125_1656 [Leptospira mayottensis 200901122]|uniref:Uncharacterized protein n=1 Tax=Leptospira mayottensis 200901122 TaxID=1193010 RepID=A0AA87MKC7_9LEPT|nr:hypothetical protein LEP1GSC125_1656 [Leptospira mayottensis 200901122]